MRSFVFALVFFLALPAAAEDVSGAARVVDGDTLEIGSRRVHLLGIDAPELAQTCERPGKTVPCGQLARTALMDLLAGAKVVCRTRDEDPEGGWRGTCRADGFDVGRNMVHTGWALADPRRDADYKSTETKSKKAKRGLWRGPFMAPWEWRQSN